MAEKLTHIISKCEKLMKYIKNKVCICDLPFIQKEIQTILYSISLSIKLAAVTQTVNKSN